jgi:predicted transposase YbfD/YdcC
MTERKDEFPKHEDIERRAYELYLESGSEDGHAEEHWLIAEQELARDHAKSAEDAAQLRRKGASQGGRADD